MNSISEMIVAVVVAAPGETGMNWVYWIVPNVNQVMKMPTMKPQSPTRLVTKAFLPAEALAGFSKVSSRLSPSTSSSMEKTKRLR